MLFMSNIHYAYFKHVLYLLPFFVVAVVVVLCCFCLIFIWALFLLILSIFDEWTCLEIKIISLINVLLIQKVFFLYTSHIGWAIFYLRQLVTWRTVKDAKNSFINDEPRKLRKDETYLRNIRKDEGTSAAYLRSFDFSKIISDKHCMYANCVWMVYSGFTRIEFNKDLEMRQNDYVE